MTTLKNLKGTAIQFLAEDPVLYVGTWASGGNVNTARGQGGGAGDSNSANLFFGGQVTGNANSALTENYNGTAWTEVADLNETQVYISGTGSSTAALTAGGLRSGGTFSVNAETWNGSAWTEVANLNVGRHGIALFGTSTSAIGASGYSSAVSPTYALNVEQWNGSSWTEIAEVNYGKYGAAAAGTSVSAGLVFGGENPGMPAEQQNTESWNGSAWTEVADMATTRSWVWSGGTSTDALVSGGQPGSVNTEVFNGTSWTEVNNLATERRYAAGKCGTTAANCMWVSGVGSPPVNTKIATTEEWSFPPTPLSQLQEGQMWFNSTSSTLKGYGTAAGLPGATWASGSNINSARSEFGGGAGTQQAFLIFGGQPSPLVALTESYNGSSWTEVNDLNAGRYYATGFGTQTSAICASGNPGATVNVESWNGSNWTETGNVNTGRWGAGSSKSSPSTSGLIAGGSTGSDTGATETWNGSAWTEVADLNTARRQVGSCGDSQTAVLIMSGNPAPKVVVEQWNGTSWTEVGDVGASRYGGGGSGTTTSALFIGGAPDSKANELWNGTSWTEVADTAKYHDVAASGGSGVSAIVAGGRGSGQDAHFTEEWTADATVSTVTTS